MSYRGLTARNSGGVIEASVMIGGVAQDLWRDDRSGQLFVAGVPGQAYTLQVTNLTGGRVEVISAVDGRNTLKDEPADVNGNSGMVIRSRVYEFTGWRINDDEVREFIFGNPAASVAAQATGSAANVGVIGFAAWREHQERPYFFGALAAAGGGGSYTVSNTTAVADSLAAPAAVVSRAAAPAGQSLGTGIGQARADRVGRTTFARAAGGPDVLTIRYETREVLDGMGVTTGGGPEPRAFPGSDTGYGRYVS